MISSLSLLPLVLFTLTQAHGDHGGHGQAPLVAPDADWATRHMAEEHHIDNFDAGSFFTLHDYDSSNEWTPEDILKTYGLKDHTTSHISQSDKDSAVRQVLSLFDSDNNGAISFAEFTTASAKGVKLPDFGYGPGHHGDDEYEYEIHHFEKFHGPDTTEEDLIHPEDIEHFKMHEEMEAAQERQEEMDRMSIVEENIPKKFLRHGAEL